MGAKGIRIAEECHVVNILPPVDQAGGKSSDIFYMGNYAHATIIVQAGSTNADAGNVTVEACNDFAASVAHTEIVFDYYAEETAAGDTLGARTEATTAGIDVSGNDSIMYVIEIDAAELPAGKPYLRISWSAPGGATIGSAVAILSGSRYAMEQSPTAIA
jgi:hypothetical protein